MKTKKQRKITGIQVETLGKKLIVLEHRRCHVVQQTTPLRIMLRKYIKQNMEVLSTCSSDVPGSDILHWAADKVKRGYFGDATLKKMIRIVHILKSVKWKE